MLLKNQKGITLVELLATLAIAAGLLVLISSVLFQAIRSKEVSDQHVNLRQEANLIITMFSAAHVSSGATTYDFQYKRINSGEWSMTIGNQQTSSKTYKIAIEMVGGTKTYIIDADNTQELKETITKKEKLNIKSLQLIDKNNSNNRFELSTIVSRM